MHPGINVRSLWELLDSDKDLILPTYGSETLSIQDCWRSRDRHEEQEAVRSLLSKMGFEYLEIEPNRENTRFCGVSLLRPQPPRNPRLAPRHYVDGCEVFFKEHSEEEQEKIMREYSKVYKTERVVCYCHYCLEGLLLAGVNALHAAELIFGPCLHDKGKEGYF